MNKEKMPLFEVNSLVENDDNSAVPKTSGRKTFRKRGVVRRSDFIIVIAMFLAAALLFGILMRNKSKRRRAEALERQSLYEIENEFFGDLRGVGNADYASLIGLDKGAERARLRQKKAVEELDLPLEVENRFTGIRFRLIPAGSFIMGSSRDESGRDGDEKRHEVVFEQPFYCGKHEITQRQWRKIMGSKKAHFFNAGRSAPVENVSWAEARQFVDNLCKKSGVTNITYRLLSEAQWEYACRAGAYTPLYSGDLKIEGHNNASALDAIGWYAGNSSVEYEGARDSSAWPEKQFSHTRAGTHPVGRKKPNAFGLYDMIGNVSEWCGDWYGEYPAVLYTNNPSGPKHGHYKVVRGGAWNSPARKCRAADRDRALPRFRDACLGFRILRVIRFEPYP